MGAELAGQGSLSPLPARSGVLTETADCNPAEAPSSR